MDWIFLHVIVISLVGPIFAAISARQSSTWNTFDASLTLDSNPTTCAKSGFHNYSWYIQDMGESKTINKVFVNGKGLQNVFITVGDNDRSSGLFRGFTNNHDCNIVKDEIPSGSTQEITCFLPVSGRYITLEMLSEGPKPHQLEICEFSFQSI